MFFQQVFALRACSTHTANLLLILTICTLDSLSKSFECLRISSWWWKWQQAMQQVTVTYVEFVSSWVLLPLVLSSTPAWQHHTQHTHTHTYTQKQCTTTRSLGVFNSCSSYVLVFYHKGTWLHLQYSCQTSHQPADASTCIQLHCWWGSELFFEVK